MDLIAADVLVVAEMVVVDVVRPSVVVEVVVEEVVCNSVVVEVVVRGVVVVDNSLDLCSSIKVDTGPITFVMR